MGLPSFRRPAVLAPLLASWLLLPHLASAIPIMPDRQADLDTISRPSPSAGTTPLERMLLDDPGFDGTVPEAPRDQTNPLASALNLLNAGKAAEAIEATRAFLKDQPNSAPAREILGAALALKGEVDLGLAELKRAVTLDPKRSSAMTKIGDIHLARGQVKEAREQFQAALKITPDDRRAHQRLGIIYEREGKTDLAIAHFEKGIQGTPSEYLGIKVNLGRLYNQAGKFDKTVALLQPVVTKETRDATAHLVLGTAYRGVGKPDQALASFQAAAALEPKASRGLIAMGIAYRDLGRGQESLAALQKAVQLDPKSDIAQLHLGETQFALRQFDRALASFQAAEKANPKLLLAKKRSADALVAQNKIPAAIPIYKDLLKRPGLDRPELYDALGTAYQLNNELPLAEKTFQELAQKYPKHPTAYLRLGLYYGYVKKYDQALAQFNRGLQHATDKRTLLRAISVAQRQKGDHAASLKTAEELVKLPQSGVEEKAYLATLYQDGKKLDDAAKLYREIIASQPDHILARNNLAAMLSDAGKHTEALPHAERAASLAPESPNVLDTYGWVLVRSGQAQKALEPLKKAVGAAPANPTLLYHLAVAHNKNGQRAEALAAVNRAIEAAASFPDRNDAEKLRADLQQNRP